MISGPAALAGIALSLSITIAGAWLVQHRTGNAGRVDTIWTFAIGLVGAASALADGSGTKREAIDARGLSDDPVAPALAAYRDTDGRHRIGSGLLSRLGRSDGIVPRFAESKSRNRCPTARLEQSQTVFERQPDVPLHST
jgi:hypothetical protein